MSQTVHIDRKHILSHHEFACQFGLAIFVYAKKTRNLGKPGGPRECLIERSSDQIASRTGDILFNNNLVATLEALRTDHATFKQLLVVGRRTNYKFKDKEEIYNLDPVYRYATAGELFTTKAQDFFISTHSGFPWDSIPDFVVGRVGYDNWLVATAVSRNFSVVDATATVTALHQTGVDGNYAGRRKQKGDDTYVNHRLAGPFDYSNGITTCANLMTRWRKDLVVLVQQPDLYRKRCIRAKNMYNINKGKRIASILAATRVRATFQRNTSKNNVFSSKYSRFLRTMSKASDLQGRTTISSLGIPVTSHATRVILPTPMRADVQSPIPMSRQSQLPTSKLSQMPLPTTSPLVKQANISLSPI